MRVLFLDRQPAYLKNVLICDIHSLLLELFFNNVGRLLLVCGATELRDLLGVGQDVEKT